MIDYKYESDSENQNFFSTEDENFWQKRPITFVYWAAEGCEKEIKPMLNFLCGPIFKTNLEKVEYFNRKYKITVSGSEESLRLVEKNLNAVFSHYREEYDIIYKKSKGA